MLESLFNIVGCRAEGLQLYWKEIPTRVFSCEVCELFKNTFFTKNFRWLLLNKPGNLRGSFSKGIFWLFSITLPWLSNIMLNLLTKSFFDISLLFKLNYAAISLILWTVNKSCYKTHFVYMNTQKWFI